MPEDVIVERSCFSLAFLRVGVGPILSRIRSSVTVSSSARTDKLIWDTATTVRLSCRSMDASYFTWSTVRGELNCVRDRSLLFVRMELILLE